MEKLFLFNEKINSISSKLLYGNRIYDYKRVFITLEKNYVIRYIKNKILLEYNKAKNTRILLYKLINILQRIYNKKVEFNIVNLKKMHYNSDIYTQAISLKLKNKNNKLYRVLKASLRKVRVIKINKLTEQQEKFKRSTLLVNRIGNKTINDMFNASDIKNKNLDNLLLEYYPSINNLKTEVKIKDEIRNIPLSLQEYVLTSLKHIQLYGLRVEAKGRLTRRFTASRSVFKMKWKGGIKNVDSSFGKISTIMLRGTKKSNLQYSIVNSKNRNGAFAVKG
jgi:hypothetical protein